MPAPTERKYSCLVKLYPEMVAMAQTHVRRSGRPVWDTWPSPWQHVLPRTLHCMHIVASQAAPLGVPQKSIQLQMCLRRREWFGAYQNGWRSEKNGFATLVLLRTRNCGADQNGWKSEMNGFATLVMLRTRDCLVESTRMHTDHDCENMH